MNNIYLIGMMGSGKTATSVCLGNDLSRETVDMDAILVEREGMTISDIFEKKGEIYFRNAEKDLLAEICEMKNVVVSTGGGVVLNEENMHCMQATGVVVYLKASTDILVSRLEGKKDRPLLHGETLKEKLTQIFNLRAALYETGTITIDTDGKTPQETADMVVEALKI